VVPEATRKLDNSNRHSSGIISLITGEKLPENVLK
jgi:hypothetical protein